MNGARTVSSAVTRREVLAIGVGAFVVLGTGLVTRARAQVIRRTVPVMGTIAEFAVVHRDATEAHATIDAAIAELTRVDALMSRFTGSSDVGRANGRAAVEGVRVSAETMMVLREALAWAEASDGAFDPALGQAIRVWDVGHRTTPPEERVVRRLAGRRLYRALDVGHWRGAPAVRFTAPDVEIDLGGIAKGWAVDRAADALRARGISHALVNVGGDLVAIGGTQDGDPWRIGVQSPWERSRLAGEFAIRDGAVATSGDYLQSFTYRGQRYHHLLDPATGAPRRTPVRSVTVMAATCVAADAATTAVYGLSRGPAERILASRAPGATIVSELADT
ncbi:MAG: FAD:protein FMN transferase [Candidatus Rokubacteria bacterium]|nr:FAD:protein FMN transferase [Candidatus Rokubacteria bacterium]